MSLELAYVNPDFGQDWRIISPTVVGNRMRALDQQVSLLNIVIADDANTGRIAGRLGGTEFIRAWAAFVGEWTVFYRENQDWLSRFTSGVVSQAESYARRYNTFEAQLLAFDLEIVTGTPTREDVESGTGGSVLLWGALGVAALFGVAWLLREGRGVAHEARAFLPPTSSPSRRRGVAGLSASLLPSLTR